MVSFRFTLSAAALLVMAAAIAAESPAESGKQTVFRGGERIKVIVPPTIGESIEQVVSSEGFIALPTGGLLNVKDKTLREAQESIIHELKQKSGVENVFATIAIMQAPTDRAFIGGEVRTPQALTLDPARPMKILSAIIATGGTTPQGDLSRIKLIRTNGGKEKKILTIDLSKLDSGGAREQDPVIEPDDLIIVPRTPVVFMVGEFEKPGAYFLSELHISAELEPRLSRVIGAGGGLHPSANKKMIKVIHTGDDGKKVVRQCDVESLFTGKPGSVAAPAGGDTAADNQADPVVADGDVIVAPAGGGITILGKVHQPGNYPITGGDGLKLTRLIAMAGGFDEYAKASNVIIVRAGAAASPVRVDVQSIAKGNDADVTLGDGDLVFVGERFF